MIAEMKAKAKKGKNQGPSVEVLDVAESERDKGVRIAAY